MTAPARIRNNRAGRLRVGGVLAAAIVAALITGCGSSTTATTNTTGAQSTPTKTPTTPANPGLAHAEAAVAADMKPVTSYSLPSQSVKVPSSVKGKTVMYIPLLQAIPAFAITASALHDALATTGMQLSVCDGGANPTTVAACVSRGVSEGVAGIVTDAIPYGMAGNAFAAATKQGVPVLITDQIPQPGTASADKLAYQPGNVNQPQPIADWIIADSKGTANAIVGEEADSPSTIYYIQHYLTPEFQKYCPSCNVQVKKVTASTPQQIASFTNSTVLNDPNAQYYYTEFEDDLPGVLAGLQQAGKSNSIKVEAATATIAGLTKLKQGQTVAAEVGDDVNYEGWADADDLLRMIAHQPTVTENIPERLFTAQNIGTIALTQAAQASGQWYGNPAAFKSEFKKLWGES
jgi:ribose transport system substrate-binding protein